MKSGKWRLIAWSWEDGEFTIELENSVTEEIVMGDNAEWVVSEVERLIAEEIYVPTGNPEDEEEMEWTGKDIPWRDYSELPEWITEQL